MTDYKAIKGKRILSVASDLDNAEAEGQIWFNTTSEDYKTVVKVAGAWASGANVGTARAALEGADGSSIPAGLIFAGRTTGSAGSGQTEEYNGTAWSEQTDLNVDRWRGGGAGTQTAGFSFAGSTGPTTHVKTAETYDGSSWTEVGDTNSNHTNTIGFGSTTAAFCVAGYSGTANVAIVEEYNGTSWTEIADINTARNSKAGCGTTTAAIVSGGETPGARVGNAEQWNGSAWTEVGDLNEGRIHLGGAGISSACISFGGEPGPAASTKTEQWDDSTWTEIADLSTARARGGSGGTLFSAFFAAGATPSATAGVNNTEEWDYSSTLAAGAWASGGNLPSSRGLAATMGTQTATLIAKGYSESGTSPSSGGYFNNSLEYDGSSWGSSVDLNRAHGSGLAAAGTQTAGLLVGGGEYVFPGSNTATEEVETYDGSSWTEIADINTERYDGACGGTQTAAILFGGYDPALSPINIGNAETWNGSTWTEVADLNTARRRLMGSSIGTSTASLAVGGYTGYIDSVETWNGTSWTEITDLNTARHSGGGCGTQTEAFAFGGWNGEAVPNCEEYDGSAWTEVADLTANVNGYGSGAGTQSLAIIAGGGPLPANPGTLSTEEWTKAQNIKTITD